MLVYIVDLILTFAVLLIYFCLIMFTGALNVFLRHIHILNSATLGTMFGILMYMNYRTDFTVINVEIHPAICIVSGIVLLLATLWAQSTKVGFWIFAIIMSIVWAFIPALLTYAFTRDKIWTIVVAVVAVAINIFSHIQSRKAREEQL